MKYEYNGDYKIVHTVCFDDGGGFAFGVNTTAFFPLATWQFTEENNKKTYFCGYYFALESMVAAKHDFDERAKKYKSENPGVTEKYNYLASVEMSNEGNYNMIDGVINNIPKPSVLEKMTEYERLIAESDNNNNADEPKIYYPSKDEL